MHKSHIRKHVLSEAERPALSLSKGSVNGPSARVVEVQPLTDIQILACDHQNNQHVFIAGSGPIRCLCGEHSWHVGGSAMHSPFTGILVYPHRPDPNKEANHG